MQFELAYKGITVQFDAPDKQEAKRRAEKALSVLFLGKRVEYTVTEIEAEGAR